MAKTKGTTKKLSTVRVDGRTRGLLDEVTEQLQRRGFDRLPDSVREGVHAFGEDGRPVRISHTLVVHLALLSLERALGTPEA